MIDTPPERARLLAALNGVAAAHADGDTERATRYLRAQVAAIDERHIQLADRARRLAQDLDAPDLALHFALCGVVATAGRRDAVVALADVASNLPRLRTAAARILERRSTAGDWSAVARADGHRSWTDITSLGTQATVAPSGGAGTADGVQAIDASRVFGWRVDGARATWTRTSWAIGTRSPDGRHVLVPELSDHNIGAALSWAPGRTPAPDTRPDHVALVVGRWPFTNYFHWLTEALHDIVVLDLTGALARLDRVVIAMDGPPPAFVGESLGALGFDPAQFEVRTEPFDIVAASLTVVTRDALSPRQLGDELARRLRLRVSSAPPTDRLLVSRRDVRARRVSNEDELADDLGSLGFRTVTPGRLTFREQAAQFRSAGLIVAPHGAALANLVFAAPGTALVELLERRTPPRRLDGFAHRLGVRYAGCPCAPAADEPEALVADGLAVRRLVETMLPSVSSGDAPEETLWWSETLG